MLAPRLRHRVDIGAFKTVQDQTDGTQTESWVPAFSSVPAEITPLSGSELLSAAAAQSKATARIVIRAGLALVETMRIKHGDDLYNIVAVIDDPTFARHVSILAEKGLRNG